MNKNILLSKIIPWIDTDDSLSSFFEKNDVDKLQIRSLIQFSVKSGNLNNVIYLHQNGHIRISDSNIIKILEDAAEYGHTKIIRYLHENGAALNYDNFIRTSKKATKNDQSEILRYYHQMGCTFTNDVIDDLAILCGLHGSLNCLKYLCENGLLILDIDHIWQPFLKAMQNNQLNIVEYFYKNAGFDEYFLYKTISLNQIEILKYAHQKEFHFTENLILQLAILSVNYKSMDCLKYLYKNNLLTIDEDNFQKNDLQYILTKYYLTRSTFDLQEGKIQENFESLRTTLCILHEDNTINIDEAFTFADESRVKLYYFISIANGRDYIFHLLRNIFPSLLLDKKISQEAFELALVNNRLDIISFFINMNEVHFNEKQIIKNILRSAAQFCKIPALDILINYYGSLGVPIVNRLLYYATVNQRLDILQYLVEKGASIQIFLKIQTASLPEGPVRRFLSDRKCLNELKEDLNLIEQMKLEVLSDEKVFHPSHFWNFFNEVNVTLLKESGFRNFKRNINQNYFNFIPVLFKDLFLNSILFLRLFRYIKSPGHYELIDPDVINNEGDLKEIYRCVFQKNRNIKLFLYKFTIGGLWDYVSERDPENLLQHLEEPRTGNPIEITKDQKLISQDLANSVQEYYFISPYVKTLEKNPIRIVEIGAGYGRLGYVLLSALNCKYIIFDISPALYVAQKYLSEIFPDKKIFTFRHISCFEDIKEELEQSDIAFFSINQIKFFPENYCDLCINISSLHEMTKEQRNKISEYMSKITKNFIYIKQYKKYKNPFDKIIVKERNYKFLAPWLRIKRRTTPTNIRFFEMLLQKSSVPLK